MNRPGWQVGFTLIELVMVIMLTGVLAAVVGRFIAQPVQGYVDVTRRAALVSVADSALQRITRGIRLALPNSIRISGSSGALEFLRIRTGGRYRVDTPGDPLDFTASTDTFDVLGTLGDAGSVVTNGAAAEADCISGTVDCLVVYNTGQTGANAYDFENIAGIRSASGSAISSVPLRRFPMPPPMRDSMWSKARLPICATPRGVGRSATIPDIRLPRSKRAWMRTANSPAPARPVCCWSTGYRTVVSLTRAVPRVAVGY